MRQQLPYFLRQDPDKKPTRHTLYSLGDLRRMTFLQLRDICEREKIIHASLGRLGREELIRLILRFRGDRAPKLIRDEAAGGLGRLEEALRTARRAPLQLKTLVPAKLVVYEGLDTTALDGYALPYAPELDGVNALVVDRDERVRGILNLEARPGRDNLCLTRSGALPCSEASVKDYRLYLFPKDTSDALRDLYYGEAPPPREIRLLEEPLLDYQARRPVESDLPLVVDFGTSNTTAGVYVDRALYGKIEDGVKLSGVQPERVYYARFLDGAGEASPILPTVIGVDRVEGGKVWYNIGHEAERMVAEGYLGAGYSVFYDIKRWVTDYEAVEDISDCEGRRASVARKDILRAFLRYVIDQAGRQLKCRFHIISLTYPVKQKERFLRMYRAVLPEARVEGEDALDEGVAVLYNIIGGMIDERGYEDGRAYKALIIDCGGGTTDLSSCRFSVRDQRVGYEIGLETAYENGDTDFGGNNLTYRLLQLLKIEAAHSLTGKGASGREVAAGLGRDVFRQVDQLGVEAVYGRLEEAYQAAEAVIPTRFKDYELIGRSSYYMVKNNYYYLFSLAERLKKIFFGGEQVGRATVSSEGGGERDTAHIDARRWKLAVYRRGELGTLRDFPPVTLDGAMARAILRPDIYNVVRRFLSPHYESGGLSDFDIIKLTGQSCEIDLFTESVTQFMPGKLIERRDSQAGGYPLKLGCLSGALRYLNERRLGLARVRVSAGTPALPYRLSALTHTGERLALSRVAAGRERISGGVSRRGEGAELRLFLSDGEGKERHTYAIHSEPGGFKPTTYEDIAERFGGEIPQGEVDAIESGETRYFVWADERRWGFWVAPIARAGETPLLGESQFIFFEDGAWLRDNFDGLR